jgi:four helix bundle protein
MDLVDAIYAAVRSFPSFEVFRLAAQMCDAATSIPSNIAEGQGRHSLLDFRHFLRQARASGHELETRILIAERQHYISVAESEALVSDTIRVIQLINGLIRHLNQRLASVRPTANGKRPTS